ncbi:6-hydroxymethylpterin diphosphokinase MptE-like protein [Fundidesulfovibrio terrae]|uniref:motility associated factor glycosyltransferase family protein n=1 Tax=Fundidesulfovibrio terrae TaxID=2922866 RepID=UPI001FAF286F|nr:6-hydroxymethylpterin diphosphokinase MptE-like protein [Fundidesulfovibrio terrae]
MKSLAVFDQLGLLALSQAGAGSYTPGARHAFHAHNPLWAYCNPALARPFAGGSEGDFGPEVFAFPPPDTGLDEAMRRTRLLVFLGAQRTPELQAALARTDGVCLIFEPDPERMAAFLDDEKPWELAGKGVFFVAGDPDRTPSPLLQILPENLASLGYPLFFACEGLPEALPGYVRRVEEVLELFYYRNVIYTLDSQDNIRGLPIRPLVRNAVYDRYKHLYENLAPCLRGGELSDLLGALTGHTAILAAAGPALTGQIEFIRANQDRAAVIAVNSALKPLLKAGIEPDFVIINDTSMDSEPTLAGLPGLKKARLVAHCLSTTGQGGFERAWFFGNFPGQPFPKRDSLLLHGSVITTAFALAEYMGCSRVYLAGVQLASPDPLAMNYSKGSQHEAHASGVNEMTLTHRWPQLYPATAADGSRMFTTLNFFDSAQWFADRIRMANMEVVNLTPSSILQGPGIAFDPAPVLPEDPGLARNLDSISSTDFSARRERVLDYIRQELTLWKTKQRAARQAGESFSSAAAFIAASDQDNTSFMLQRFADFDNTRFHTAFFEGADEGRRMEGARYFLGYMDRMCEALLKILLAQHKRVQALPGRPE